MAKIDLSKYTQDEIYQHVRHFGYSFNEMAEQLDNGQTESIKSCIKDITEYKSVLEFVGYKLAPCNNGQAWDTPFKTSRDNPFKFSYAGRLFGLNIFDMRHDWNNIVDLIKFVNNKKGLKLKLSLDINKNWDKIIKAIQ